MPFQMKVSNDAIEGKDVLPPGIYELRLMGFKPKFSKNSPGDLSKLNLNAQLEVINHPDLAGRKVYVGLNMSAAWIQQDFCHALGLPMETDGKESWLPGTWDSATDFDQTNDATFKYVGPMLSRTMKVEIVVDSYNNKPKNEISRYFCAVADCATKFPKIRHSMNLLQKS